MTKKIMSLVICVALILSCFCTSVGAVGINSRSDVNIIEYKADTTFSALNNADVISVEYDYIDEIAEYAKIWIDAGKTLYITSPEVSAESIAEELSIPKDGINAYNEAILFAYSIYSIDNCYIFENHYAVLDKTNSEEAISACANDAEKAQDLETNTDSFEKAITINEYKTINPTVTAADFTDWRSVTIAASEIESFDESFEIDNGVASRSASMMSGCSRIYVDNLYVYDNNDTYCGYLRGTVYVYDIGRGLVNNTEGFLYNVVTHVKAYPNTGYVVKEYSCTYNYCIQGHMILDSVTLPSGVSITESLSLTGSLSVTGGSDGSVSGEVGGTVGYSTAWTYNPESQIITESSTDPRIITWTAETVRATSGKAYDVTPNATIFVTPGYTNQRGAYAHLRCDSLFFGISTNVNELTIGGWF